MMPSGLPPGCSVRTAAGFPALVPDLLIEARRILAEIEKKVAGQEISTAAPEEAGQAQVIDIMEALKASLARPKPTPAAADDEHRAPKQAPAAKKPESKKASKK